MMLQIKSSISLATLVIMTAINAAAQNAEQNQSGFSDTTYTIQFNWALENEKRQGDNMTYAGANYCSRWIKFTDSEFLKLKDLDGKKVKITIQRSVWEGLESKKARGVDTRFMQGTAYNINCNCIIKIDIDE